MDGGMLSQDEINALLNGMGTDAEPSDAGSADTALTHRLTQGHHREVRH